MDKILYATLSVEKGNKKDEVKVYKIKGEKYGIQVESNIDSKLEVNLAENKISNESPLGTALLGAKKGQTVEVEAPAGKMKYKILEISL